MLSETYYRLAVLSNNQPAGIIHILRPAGEIGKKLDIVLQLRIFVELAFKHLVGGHGICLCSMGVLEILPAAIEPVCGFEIARLHRMVDCLHINHLLVVKIDVKASVKVLADTFNLFCEHREVEFR